MKRAARAQFEVWAESYDRFLLSRLLFEPSHRAMVQELVRGAGGCRGEGGDLLDVGCGTGSLVLMAVGTEVVGRGVGLDYALRMCRAAERKARQAGLEGAAGFVRGDSEHLPFGSSRFDVVTCSNSFHHYPRQGAALAEMRRVLRPGGRLLLVDGFRDNVIGWMVFDVCVGLLEGRVHHLAWREAREAFARAGFIDIYQRKLMVWLPLLLTVGRVPA